MSASADIQELLDDLAAEYRTSLPGESAAAGVGAVFVAVCMLEGVDPADALRRACDEMRRLERDDRRANRRTQ